MKKISIIVPVYNVEQYLEKCVESLIRQSYHNLEIILVNDGSTDTSAKLCDFLSKKDDRIKVIHKENGGLSDARNHGVNAASGEYIGFVDSDDYIHEDMYHHLYEKITQEDADVAECNFTIVYENKFKYVTEEEYDLVLNQEQYLQEYLSMKKLYGATCARLIKASIAKKIEFPVGKVYEDMYYALELIQIAKKYVITSKPYYYYLVRTGSITNEHFNERQLALIDVVKDFKTFTLSSYPNLKKEMLSREMYAYFSVFNQIIRLREFKKNYYYVEIRNYFKKNWLKILQNPIITKNRKLSVFLIKINVYLYRFVLIRYLKGEQSS